MGCARSRIVLAVAFIFSETTARRLTRRSQVSSGGMGASKPWPDALEALTGQRQMDASAILDYFAPLQTWLDAQNKGQVCGW